MIPRRSARWGVGQQSRDADVLETLLEYVDSDVVFLESAAGAYSQIKRVVPDLVVMCFPIDIARLPTDVDAATWNADTASIPVIAHALEGSPGMVMN